MGFGKETNKLKHWLGLKVFKLIEDPLGFYFLRHLDGAIEDLHEGKSSKRLRYAKAACSQVVLEAKVREGASRTQITWEEWFNEKWGEPLQQYAATKIAARRNKENGENYQN